MEANPASTEGVIKIMMHLHKYVPTKENKLHTIPCNGDQLSVERMKSAKKCRLPDMLQGLLETPQEFHKEGVTLQVSWIKYTLQQFYTYLF